MCFQVSVTCHNSRQAVRHGVYVTEEVCPERSVVTDRPTCNMNTFQYRNKPTHPLRHRAVHNRPRVISNKLQLKSRRLSLPLTHAEATKLVTMYDLILALPSGCFKIKRINMADKMADVSLQCGN